MRAIQSKQEVGLAAKPASNNGGDLSLEGQAKRLLVQGSLVPVVAGLFVAVLMLWAMRGSVPLQDMAVWSALLVLSYGVRLVLFQKPKSYTHILGMPFLSLFTGLTFLSGLVWGLAGVWFFDPDQIQFQALLAFCAGGLAAGAVVSYASWPKAFVAFAYPALLPLIVQLFVQQDDVQFVMGTMLVVYLGVLSLMTRMINKTLVQNLEFESALGTSEGRFRGVFENSPAGMVLMRLDGEILMVNQAFAELTGYPREVLSGRNWREITYPEDIDTFEAIDQQIVEGTLPDLMVEKRYLHADGHAIWTDVATCQIVSPNQTDVFLLRQVFDISALKSVERMKNEFVSTVSHELRTPLTSIDGSLGLILGGAAGQISEPAREMAELARKNSQRLISLVSDILDIDRLESNDLSFNYAQVDVNKLVQETLDWNAGLAEAADVKFRYHTPTEALQVVGDAGRLSQVLTNLLSNAVKFSPKSSEIEIDVNRVGKHIRVSVRDQGPGIPDSFRSSIFNRFSQADASDTRAKGGAGLGLHISRSILDKHAGVLDFTSVPGDGATFYFELREWKGTEPLNKAIEKLHASGLRPGR